MFHTVWIYCTAAANEEFKRLGKKADFFAILHSSGKVDERNGQARS
jgi:GTP-dependent phosphoenolpyruvate carboxykinase